MYQERKAITRTLSFDDFDAMYGIVDDTFDECSPRQRAYYLNSSHPELTVVLSECLHNGKKERHHPNYEKPHEVELLCRSCHHARHKDTNPFNRFSETKRKRMHKNNLHTRSLSVPTEEIVPPPPSMLSAEDRGLVAQRS